MSRTEQYERAAGLLAGAEKAAYVARNAAAQGARSQQSSSNREASMRRLAVSRAKAALLILRSLGE